jgi:heme oxygenase
MHQMMPLRDFKRNIDEKRLLMGKKVEVLVQQFSDFMDKFINEIKEIKARKCLELSMLWVRDLSKSEDEYELIKRIYRMDFKGISCKDVHDIYFKIIHNEKLFTKNIDELDCYKGICKVLEELTKKQQATKLLAEKLTKIEGVLSNGEILKKVLPDKMVKD